MEPPSMNNVWTTELARVVLGSAGACRRVKEIPVFTAQCQSLLRSDSEDGTHWIRTSLRSGLWTLVVALVSYEKSRLLLLGENLIRGGGGWIRLLVSRAVEPSCKAAPHELNE
jgi:hypothetical protein